MIKVAAFDFDGVIAESADIKTDAFRALYADRPEYVEAVVEHHRANEGISRYRKFRHIHERILGEEYDQTLEDELDARFTELVFQAVVEAPLVHGAVELLEMLSGSVPLYVVSGTPDNELSRIVDARGLSGFFAGVFGSSRGKPELLREVIATEGVAPEEVLFVGDALSDLSAASETEVTFVARITPGDERRFEGARAIARVNDMAGLAQLVREGPLEVAGLHKAHARSQGETTNG
jgi:HAD superfamily hydrolase (TIGR01549 family)